jgi:hypothetical protein
MGWLKEKVYATEVRNREDLVCCIWEAAENIRYQPRLMFNVMNSVWHCCEVCLNAVGSHFKQL